MNITDERQHCHDCDVLEGELHEPGCDMEVCPMCWGQRLMCDCPDLPDEERIPFIYYPTRCGRCGDDDIKLFSVPDQEWEYYIEPNRRQEVLCLPCYEQIKAWIDECQNPTPKDYAQRRLITIRNELAIYEDSTEELDQFVRVPALLEEQEALEQGQYDFDPQQAWSEHHKAWVMSRD